MTTKEKNEIKYEIKYLTGCLDSMRRESDKAIDKGNWNDMNYWKGRIEQTKRELDFLHEITNWEFTKNE